MSLQNQQFSCLFYGGTGFKELAANLLVVLALKYMDDPLVKWLQFGCCIWWQKQHFNVGVIFELMGGGIV